MLKKLLCSVALVVSLSASGLADVAQNQGFAIGMNSAINLLGSSITADDIKFLAIDLQQVTMEGPGLSAITSNAAIGQTTGLFTSGTSLFASGGSIISGLQIPNSAVLPLNGGQPSLFTHLPLLLGN